MIQQMQTLIFAMIKLVMVIIVLRRRDNVRLLVEMTTWQKALAIANANLIS